MEKSELLPCLKNFPKIPIRRESRDHNQVIDRDFKGLDSLLMGILGKFLRQGSNSDFSM